MHAQLLDSNDKNLNQMGLTEKDKLSHPLN